MTTEQRTGFRLPWSSDRSEPQPAGADESAGDPATEVVNARPGEPTGDATADASGGGPVTGRPDDPVAATDGQPEWPEADIAPTSGRGRRSESNAKEPVADEGSKAGEPPAAPPPDSEPPGAAAPVRRPSVQAAPPRPISFLAEMSRAMQAAAKTARDESLARLAAEAKQRIDEIQEQVTTGTAELRRKADDDVAAAREWSKAEIARIREETDRRIAERKAQLEVEVEGHAASVRRRTDLVRELVARHEAELDAFMNRLMAENDPARIATLAQEVPAPPDLAGDWDDLLPEPADPADTDASTPPVPDRATSTDQGPAVANLTAAGAAAAEAEALSELAGGADQTRAGGPSVDGAVPTGGVGRTDLLVSGLGSVAGIAGFKRELSQIAGVRSVGVSAGESGQFVFAISHDPGVELSDAVSTIAGFEAQVTGRRGGSLLVSTKEPAGSE